MGRQILWWECDEIGLTNTICWLTSMPWQSIRNLWTWFQRSDGSITRTATWPAWPAWRFIIVNRFQCTNGKARRQLEKGWFNHKPTFSFQRNKIHTSPDWGTAGSLSLEPTIWSFRPNHVNIAEDIFDFRGSRRKTSTRRYNMSNSAWKNLEVYNWN